MGYQSDLDQHRSQSGNGMGDIRDSYDRSSDQYYANSGNPMTVFNQAPATVYNTNYQDPSLGRYRPPTIDANGKWDDQGGYSYNLPVAYGGYGVQSASQFNSGQQGVQKSGNYPPSFIQQFLSQLQPRPRMPKYPNGAPPQPMYADYGTGGGAQPVSGYKPQMGRPMPRMPMNPQPGAGQGPAQPALPPQDSPPAMSRRMMPMPPPRPDGGRGYTPSAPVTTGMTAGPPAPDMAYAPPTSINSGLRPDPSMIAPPQQQAPIDTTPPVFARPGRFPEDMEDQRGYRNFFYGRR